MTAKPTDEQVYTEAMAVANRCGFDITCLQDLSHIVYCDVIHQAEVNLGVTYDE